MVSDEASMHKIFKEIKIHTAKCDQCNEHNSDTIYRCEDCSEQCCTPCWKLQGEDGKHLLNHALTVIIPATAAEKRKPPKRKPAKAVNKPANGSVTTNKKVGKKPIEQKQDLVGDKDNQDQLNEAEGVSFVAPAIEKKTARRAKKQLKSSKHVIDDNEIVPAEESQFIACSRSTSHRMLSPMGSEPMTASTVKDLVHGGKAQARSKEEIIVHEEDTTDDDLPILSVHSPTNHVKEILKVSNANKRKYSEPKSDNRDGPAEDHDTICRKKIRTGPKVDIGILAEPNLRQQRPSRPEEIDVREGAETLLLFASGTIQSSPTPSPPSTKTTNTLNVRPNAHSDLIASEKARSSSPFADLPVWPPAPASRAAASPLTLPPLRDYNDSASARKAMEQISSGPAPREDMLNRTTWFAEIVNDGISAGINANSATTSSIMDIDKPIPIQLPTPTSSNWEGQMSSEQALQLKKARAVVAKDVNQQTDLDAKLATMQTQFFEFAETVTKTKTGAAETPLRRGMAHVKSMAQAGAGTGPRGVSSG